MGFQLSSSSHQTVIPFMVVQASDFLSLSAFLSLCARFLLNGYGQEGERQRNRSVFSAALREHGALFGGATTAMRLGSMFGVEPRVVLVPRTNPGLGDRTPLALGWPVPASALSASPRENVPVPFAAPRGIGVWDCVA